MSNIHKDIEIIVRMDPDDSGINRALTIVDSSCACILAWRTCHMESGLELAFVAEDVMKAIQALGAAGFDFRIDSVILVRVANRFGVIGQLDEYLRKAGIGISHSYVSSPNAPDICAVFKTTDDTRAVNVLRENLLPGWVSHNEALKSLFLGAGRL